MYECFHCLHCSNCGAEIEYYVPVTEEDIEELKEIYGEHKGEQIDSNT